MIIFNNTALSVSISTHAPAGGATNMSLNDGSPTIFLLTPLREGRPTIRAMQTHAATISTHAPAGGATRSPFAFGPSSKFLLTPLREGRHSPRTSKNSTATYFYSRPCGRGDIKTVVNIYCETSISTHAPAGGATKGANEMIIDLILISTHAPAGGATQDSYVRCMGKKHFYSRPCGRGDVMVAQPVKPSTSISTHAPAGGATRLLPRSDEHRGNFYSRPCGRGDPGAFSESGESTISTHAPAGGATTGALSCI